VSDKKTSVTKIVTPGRKSLLTPDTFRSRSSLHLQYVFGAPKTGVIPSTSPLLDITRSSSTTRERDPVIDYDQSHISQNAPHKNGNPKNLHNTMTSNKLIQLLASPSKIATALDWRKVGGSALSLDIHKDRIGMAIASHPSFEEPTTTLEPIRLVSKGKLTDEAKDRLEQIVQEHKVCGIVVSYPLQRDTGRMGAACGRVFYTLDELMTDTKIIDPSRPLCLWDSVHPQQAVEDAWGRDTNYNRTSSKQIHLASEEQYNQDENVVAAQVWNDFVQTHWPTIHKQNGLYY
jgi:RNase H-fold protein (predicted Holliday junction resolvase)